MSLKTNISNTFKAKNDSEKYKMIDHELWDIDIWTQVSASPGSLLEMQNLRPHARPDKSKFT